MYLNPIALRKAKIVYNFGHFECSRVKVCANRKGSDQPVCLHILSYEQYHPVDGWMTCDFKSFSTVFQSYQGDERLIM